RVFRAGLQRLAKDSSGGLLRDLLHLLPPDWSPRLALQVGLRLEVGPPRPVLPAAVAVAAPAASSSQVVAVPAQLAAAPRQRDSSGPERPDSDRPLPGALVA